MTKPIDDDALLRAIEHALDRSSEALGRGAEMQVMRDRFASLTPREREVMELVVSRLLNKQVGLKLGISEITVKAHQGKMMLKMEADSLADPLRILRSYRARTDDTSRLPGRHEWRDRFLGVRRTLVSTTS